MIAMENARTNLVILVKPVDEDGEGFFGPKERVTVELQSAGDAAQTVVMSGAGGQVAFRDLDVGEYRIRRVTLPYAVGVETSRYEYVDYPIGDEETIHIANSTTHVQRTLRLPRWTQGVGKIVGSITGGRPDERQRAVMRVLRTGKRMAEERMVKVSSGDAFKFEDLPAGYYNLEAIVDGRSRAKILKVLVVPGRWSGAQVVNIGENVDAGLK